jgi:photoactive yellow protein
MSKNFDSPDILVWLNEQQDDALDKLNFGIVKMNFTGQVIFYNQEESVIAGVSKENAIGKHFFTQVAPCTNNFLVAEKFKNAVLDEQVQYIFTYITQPIPVLLRLVKGTGDYQYLLVKKV